MTEEEKKSVLLGLERAMRAEHEGQYLYLMAAKTTDDEQGKKVFLRLAQEEQMHFEFLKKQYQHVLEEGLADSRLLLHENNAVFTASPIFSDHLRERIKDAHFEMTALSVAAQLEIDAERYYRKQGEQVKDVILQTFYFELADWELGHYRMLLAEQDALKEAYWDQACFQPF